MKLQMWLMVFSGMLGAVFFVRATHADKPAHERWLQQFRRGWDEAAWIQEFRGNAGYMRPLDDQGWKIRMRAIQGLVTAGKKAVPALLNELDSASTPQRILAAHALSFLAPEVPRAPLLRAAQDDPDATVRLYAVDALGRQGGNSTVDWQRLEQSESNRDVRKHIGYAIERGNEAIDPRVVNDLVQWDASKIDSAKIGNLAPDFELQSATGETVRLSHYRGRKPVVLVFVYGDT